jgi:hypothetical protein
MCVSYHVRGRCWTTCSRSIDHRPHDARDDKELLQWCARAFGSNETGNAGHSSSESDSSSGDDVSDDPDESLFVATQTPLLYRVRHAPPHLNTCFKILQKLKESGIKPPLVEVSGKKKPVCLSFIIKNNKCRNVDCHLLHLELSDESFTAQDLKPLRNFLRIAEVAKYWAPTDALNSFFCR